VPAAPAHFIHSGSRNFRKANFTRLRRALEVLKAARFEVPRFDPEVLAGGHAVHSRCPASGVKDLRLDLMTRPRELPSFAVLWRRRTVVGDDDGTEFHLLSLPDLVLAKKPSAARTGRSLKPW
jgi:hypothetical protein